MHTSNRATSGIALSFGALLILAACGDGSANDDGNGGSSSSSPTTSNSPTTSSPTTSGNEGGGPPVPPGCEDPDHTGEATYYDFADGSGNCSFPATPDDLMVGAMNHTDYAGSAVCGACAQIDGPSGSVTIRVVDQCPECEPGDIDLSPSAFEKISPLEAGRVGITWRYVPCNVDGPLVYHFKEGSNEFWGAFQIRSSLYAIAKLELMKGGQYVELPRADYNFFIDENQPGPGPYQFRVTDVAGDVVEDSGIPFVEAGDSAGTQQFPLCTGQ